MKKYEVLVIDDEAQIVEYFEDINEMFNLNEENFTINFNYMHNVNNFEIKKPYDIVMFDCNFNAGRFDSSSRTRVGLNLIKKYRKNNKRTKIIFYSSSFNIEEQNNMPLNHRDYFEIINDLNVFKLIYKNNSIDTYNAIKDALTELDIIMTSLEKMKDEYSELDISFELEGNAFSLEDLLHEIRMDTEFGRKFRKDIVDLITNYMSKFSLREM
ncbi:CheY-like chemotaxis protein [Paenibacillus sp. PvP094]|uniref:hypothetical protein n=1 Tax=Paenibacillus sp. PvP094 TaxID=3156394 RepID=UPI003391080F